MNQPTPKKPLNCPKGYGLCYGCETWCDVRPDGSLPDLCDDELEEVCDRKSGKD